MLPQILNLVAHGQSNNDTVAVASVDLLDDSFLETALNMLWM
jgi:hypothetical protein